MRQKSLHVAMADQMYMYISGYQNIELNNLSLKSGLNIELVLLLSELPLSIDNGDNRL